MIHFSKYDNDRSIPNIMDGLKTSLRKILFTGFKRKLVKEIKVAQFSGSVSEISCYHHGEASLNGAVFFEQQLPNHAETEAIIRTHLQTKEFFNDRP